MSEFACGMRRRPSIGGRLAAMILVALVTGAGTVAGRAAEQPPAGSAPAFSPRRLVHRPSLPLPPSIQGWTRPDTVRIVPPQALFDYLDGGAELYLAYRFRRLEVCEYSHPTEDLVLVEIYQMETSDDAFGLLSLDWTGQKIELPGAPGTRALYAGGLLRLWSDDVFIRILAYRETEASRRVVCALAQAVAAGRPAPPPPAMVGLFPQSISSGHKLSGASPSFFRTPVAMNSIYLLSSQDVLDLGLSTAGMIGMFTSTGSDSASSSVYLAVVRYPGPEACRKGLGRFRRGYLSQDPGKDAARETPPKIEQEALPDREEGSGEKDGRWIGFTRQGRALALVLAAPDETTGKSFLKAADSVLRGIE